MRVRDVEIALVLAREMKAAADREVDASLRLEQLREVFGAETLDNAERARIQTALEMAGLDPVPSLLEADPAEPIRFALEGATASAAPPVPAAPGEEQAEAVPEQRQEFPTVGEFARGAFGRFRRRRSRGAGDDEVLTATHEEPPVESPPPVEAEPDPEPMYFEEPESEAEELITEDPVAEEEGEELASANGHVDAGTNGHSHLDFELPPHETATPADFGASAETIDFDDPRVEEALHEQEEPIAEEPIAEEPEAELEPLPEPEPVPVPVPVQPTVAPAGASVGELAAVLLPIAVIPVVIASFAGWSFGLPFAALALIATGVLAGRRGEGGLLASMRRSPAARTIFLATAAVTGASLALGAVLANVGDSGSGGGHKAATPAKPAPKASTPAPAAKEPAAKEPAPNAKSSKPKAQKTPAQSPNKDTQGLVRVPPPSTTTPQQPPTGTQTTPGAVPQQPAQPPTPTTPQQP